MAADPSPRRSAVEVVRDRVLPAVRLPAAIARRTLGKFRGLCLLGSASALWLAYLLRTAFDLSLLSTGLWFLLFAIPALILGWIWMLLVEVADLPARLEAFMAASQAVGHGITGAKPPAVEGDEPKRQGGLLRVGRLLKDAWSAASEYSEIAAIIGSVMSLANPLVLTIAGVAGVAAVVLALIALITALIFGV